jgi:hypothetical protein
MPAKFRVLEMRGVTPPQRDDGLPPHFIDCGREEALVRVENKAHTYVILDPVDLGLLAGCFVTCGRTTAQLFANVKTHGSDVVTSVPLERLFQEPDLDLVLAHVQALEQRATRRAVRPRPAQALA